jgi:6-phosphofructokinase 1
VTDIDLVCKDLELRHKRGKTFSLVVVSEGARIKQLTDTKGSGGDEASRRFGRIAETVARIIEEKTGYDTRVSILGHIQRGGTPTAYDRIIGTQFGIKAVDLVKNDRFGQMVSIRHNKLHSVDIEKAVQKHKSIDMELYKMSKVFCVG